MTDDLTMLDSIRRNGNRRNAPGGAVAGLVEDPDEPTVTVYPFVPIDLVHELINTHGGEANGTIQR